MTPDLKTLADPDVFMLLDTVPGVLVALMCVWSMLCLATHNTGAVIVRKNHPRCWSFICVYVVKCYNVIG